MTGKSKIYLVDTNVIVRYLLGEDSQLGQEAYSFFSEIQLGIKKAIILESVFTETIFILYKVYSVRKEDMVSNIERLLQYKGIVNEDKEFLIQSLKLYKDTKLHIVDCVLISKSRANYRLISFDRELNRIYQKRKTEFTE